MPFDSINPPIFYSIYSHTFLPNSFWHLLGYLSSCHLEHLLWSLLQQLLSYVFVNRIQFMQFICFPFRLCSSDSFLLHLSLFECPSDDPYFYRQYIYGVALLYVFLLYCLQNSVHSLGSSIVYSFWMSFTPVPTIFFFFFFYFLYQPILFIDDHFWRF